jgi:hypothetical protein
MVGFVGHQQTLPGKEGCSEGALVKVVAPSTVKTKKGKKGGGEKPVDSFSNI